VDCGGYWGVCGWEWVWSEGEVEAMRYRKKMSMRGVIYRIRLL